MRHLMIGTALLSLAACQGFDEPAGASMSASTFGEATMNNTLVQSGQRDVSIALSRRFAAEVPSTVNFAFNSAQLDGAAQATLREQADWIRQFPEVRFRVFGHTDLVGSQAYNKTLGLRRAQAVVNYLTSQGISRSRLQAVVSYGETQPLIFTEQPEMRNRRTVTEVSGFLKNHPGVVNGKYMNVVFREYINSALRPHPQNKVIITQTNPTQ